VPGVEIILRLPSHAAGKEATAIGNPAAPYLPQELVHSQETTAGPMLFLMRATALHDRQGSTTFS
jgi:hypothetical protein